MGKIKLGIGLGGWPFGESDPRPLWELVDRAEALGLDSIWLSDRVATPPPTLDPLALLAAIAARTEQLRLGTSALVVPLRNPTLLAKEVATIDFLSRGRVLLIVGVGAEGTRDFDACGVPKASRGGMLDEAIPLLRRLWSEPVVSHHGRHFQIEGAAVEPRPARPGGPPIWLGGRSDAALRRTARLGDGWLASFITPAEFAGAAARLALYCAETGRTIPEDHLGVYLPYCIASDRAAALRLADPAVLSRRPESGPETFGAFGTVADCIEKIEEYVAAGASKFILRPVAPPGELPRQLDLLAGEIVARVER